MSQTQQKVSRKSEQTEQQQRAQETPTDHEKVDKLKADTDALLDEIDEILEANAEEFVKSYVQRGGQ